MAFEAWSYYSHATPVNPSGTLTGIHTWVDLSRIAGLWGKTNPDGGDIRFSVGADTQVPHHLVYFNTGAQSGLAAINLTKQTSNEQIRVYYGNTGATMLATGDTYGQYNTYNDTVRAVYPSGGFDDATRYRMHMTMSGNPTVDLSSGHMGNPATLYNGSTDVGIYSGAGIPAFAPRSYLAWFKPRRGNDNTLMSLVRPNTNNDWTILRMYSVPNNYGTVFSERSTSVADRSVSGLSAIIPNNYNMAFARHSTDRSASINGGNLGAVDSVSCFPLSITRFALGAFYRPSLTTGLFALSDGGMSLAELHSGDVSPNWADYSYRMGDQSSFWGTWTEVDNGIVDINTTITYGNIDYVQGNFQRYAGIVVDGGTATGIVRPNGFDILTTQTYARRFKNYKESTMTTGVEYNMQIADQTGGIVDLTSFTSRQIVFTKPNGDYYAVSGTALGNGVLQYTPTGPEFDVYGRWLFKIVLDGWASDIYRFELRNTGV